MVLAGIQMPTAAFAATVTPGTPTISGSTAVGSTLTVSEGTWDPVDTTFTYEWRRDGVAIDGAPSNNTYVTVSADIGKPITAFITGTSESDTASAETTNSITPIGDFSISPAITVTGTTSVGETLSVDLSGVSPTPTSASYVWKRDGVAIDGAVSSTYILTEDDAGFGISATVTVSKTHYNDLPVTTAERAATGTFATTTDPTITGTTTFGSTLTANVTGWSPSTAVSYTYQWKRTVDATTTDIDGATAATYVLTVADIGATISVAAEGTKTGYAPVTTTSADTAAIAAATFDYTYDPEILGETTFGSTLNAHVPYWSPSSEVSYTYQWKRTVDSVTTDIDGANAATYVLTVADIDATISVAIEGSKVGYTTVPATSAESDTIAAATFSATGTPLITGDEEIGDTLTAATGTWTPTPDSFAYQWKRDGEDITDATNSTYVLTVDDMGTSITVEVTGTREGYTSETTASVATSVSLMSYITSATPVISGSSSVGSDLTATTEAWNPVPDTLDYQWMCDAADIDGATTTTLSLSASEVGCVITVSVTPTLAGYSTTARTSLGTVPVAASAFDTVGVPSISGTFAIDDVLTADPGTWTPAPDSFTYQWTRDDVAIPDATEETYTLTALDMGTDITVAVTATLEGYNTTTEISDPTAIPFLDFDTSELPTIDGTPELGATLTALGDVFSPTPDSLTYQWYRDGVAIAGETDETYTVVIADSLAEITVEVTATLLGYNELTLTSDPVTAGEVFRYTVSPRPSITGLPQVGRTLTSTTTEWTPEPDSFDYQWLRNGVAIDGATEETYDLVGADAGTAVSVRVTPVLANYVPIVRVSQATTTVASGVYTERPTPTISGATAVGQLLTAGTAGWDPTPTSFSYVWLRNGIAISGATASTYRLVAADRGFVISVRVTPVLTGYTSTAKTSEVTSVVATGTFTSTTVPTISGTVAVGQVLTAATTAWTPAATISYQWKRGGTAISGATSAQYTVAAADAGSRLTVTATGTAGEVTTVSTTSTETIVVPALSFTGGTSAVIVGEASVGSTLSVTFGTLSPTPDSVTYQWMRDGIDIDGATAATYVPTVEDQWLDITVTVTAVRVGYTSWATTSATPATISAGLIGSITVPRITGTPRVGSTLRGSNGTWTNTPDTFGYEWYRDGELLEDATENTYLLTEEDLGSSFVFGVTAFKEGYVDESAFSLATDEIRLAKFNAQPVPTITGTVKVASTLTAVAGSWSPTPTEFSYQWTRAGVPIAGATSETYTLESADAGALIRVIVAGVRENYEAEPKTSLPTVAVASGTFTSKPVPTIAGVAKVDEILTATVPAWTPTVDSSTYQWRRNGTAISGATSLTYQVAAADLGALLTFSATGIKSGFVSAVSTSANTAAVVAAVFGTQPVPTITGIASVGEMLTANGGTWLPTPSALTYQWRRNAAAIVGATSVTYVLQPADAGKEISVVVTATRTAYTTASRTSASTEEIAALIFDDAVKPTLDGIEEVGNTLRVSPGEWSPTPTSFEYQWLRDSEPIEGATAATYTLVGEDAETAISAEVTGIKLGYESTTMTTDETEAIEFGTLTATPVPTITGTARVGNQLTAVAGTWQPRPVDLAYQWMSDGGDIEDATEARYTPTAEDLGAVISVRVEASKLGYVTEEMTSDDTAEVVEGILTATPVPTITGTVQVGNTLTAQTGTWRPTDVELAYQWKRGGTNITGATAATYALVAADAGAKISLTVTGSLEAYTDVTKVSRSTKSVALGAFTAAPAPTVTGQHTVGQTLTATAGTWTPTATLTYKWLRGTKAIAGATASTYVLTTSDLGKKVSAAVVATRDGYAITTKSSSPRLVSAGVFDTAPVPTITGTTEVGSTLQAVPGSWSPTATLTYSWNRNGTSIRGATAATYTIVGADAGATLTVTVSASRTAYATTQRTSVATPTVTTVNFTASPVPTIAGTARVGSVLTASPGTWLPTPTSLAYQWYRDATLIVGATRSTYTLVAADLGTEIIVKVTGTLLGYNTLQKSSLATAEIASGVFSPAPTPTIAGTTRVGQTLTATAGTWGPVAPTLAYQWRRDTVAIDGATARTYQLTALDVGTNITVDVSATAPGFTSSTATSVATDDIAQGVLNPAPTPTITGTMGVGSTATASPGTWGPGSVSLAYRWKRNGTNITDATSSTYTIVGADFGASITVEVTATLAGYATLVKTSTARVAIAGTFTNSVSPSITGTATVGSVLTAAPGTWSPTSDSTTYQWLRGGAVITGATNATYTLVAADAGKNISVRVTVVKTNYTTTSKTSTAVRIS
jgi:hypothetical protein